MKTEPVQWANRASNSNGQAARNTDCVRGSKGIINLIKYLQGEKG